ncbi:MULTISPECIES: YchJ family protein [Microbacterium]|uniref:UPF0225 protein E4K62_07225 n=1 Tax=Microbacterium wangchenii TaxID=2541726 RepID=A0ABX5SQS0_9MICO|nr:MULTISPECIES: YchJ family metal-binding protein [Microbacterium]MCK6065026.1 SEC-C domain-containing protein [Microbacterium sp. EYE_512]QBR88496.1 hypothetical protein E4K62_07225 [Microbacterium wangchenii]TXK20223.1 hypothetical protein FVP99_00840 [Microbacterium wangchenii]
MSFGAASAVRADDGEPCPCGSGAAFGSCCGPLLAGDPAPTPERLMRSRYTAFRMRDAGHLERTWHPRTRPPDPVQLDPDVQWTGLQIVDASIAGDEGRVEFRASWRSGTSRGVLHERSRFARRGGRWLYLDGDVAAE